MGYRYSMKIRTVIVIVPVAAALLNWQKPVHGPFGQSNIHHTPNFGLDHCQEGIECTKAKEYSYDLLSNLYTVDLFRYRLAVVAILLFHFLNLTIFNIIRWLAGSMGQTTHRPSV